MVGTAVDDGIATEHAQESQLAELLLQLAGAEDAAAHYSSTQGNVAEFATERPAGFALEAQGRSFSNDHGKPLYDIIEV